jgi:hypothetical protein
MKQNKVQKGKLLRVIGLYLICLLAAFLTWIAVMYAEEKKGEDSLPEPTTETVSFAAYEEYGATPFLTV